MALRQEKEGYIIDVSGDEFKLRHDFDIDEQMDCVDVFKGKKYIGEMRNITFPDMEDTDAVSVFEKEAEEWLTENHYNG